MQFKTSGSEGPRNASAAMKSQSIRTKFVPIVTLVLQSSQRESDRRRKTQYPVSCSMSLQCGSTGTSGTSRFPILTKHRVEVIRILGGNEE